MNHALRESPPGLASWRALNPKHKTALPLRSRPKVHPDRFLLTSSKSQPNGWGEDLLSNLRCWEGGRAADPGVKPATLANDYMVFVGTGWGQRPEIDWQIEAKAQGASQQVEIRINVNLLG